MMRTMRSLVACILLLLSVPAVAWDLPPDNGTLGTRAVREILAGNEYPVTSTYTQRTEFIDFTFNGRTFTQVVVILTPDTPRLHRGRRLVVVGAEPGSEYGMDFISTVERQEGPGVWLAKRGITFVALTRIGRWNFLAPTGDGSWERRAPRRADAAYSPGRRRPIGPSTEYEVRRSGVTQVTSASASTVYRFPRKGTELEKQMLAATPACVR